MGGTDVKIPEMPQGEGVRDEEDDAWGEWTQDKWTLTAGYNLALEVVPGQIKYPEDAIVQKDQEEDEEEMSGEVKGLHDIKNLFPFGQEDGA